MVTVKYNKNNLIFFIQPNIVGTSLSKKCL